MFLNLTLPNPCGLWIIGVQPTSLILWAPSTYLSKQPLMYISISLIRLYTPTFPFILSDFHQGKLRLVFKERVTYIWKKGWSFWRRSLFGWSVIIPLTIDQFHLRVGLQFTKEGRTFQTWLGAKIMSLAQVNYAKLLFQITLSVPMNKTKWSVNAIGNGQHNILWKSGWPLK